MSRRTIGLTAALAAFVALALCLTLAAGGETEASSINAGEGSTGVSTVQATTVMGDVDCSAGANPVSATDGLKVLRYTIALPVTQTEPCDNIGTGGPPLQGDVDCNGMVDLVDSLKIIRYVAGLSVSQAPGCPLIGT